MNRVLKNTFFKSIMTLASGTILSQVITFLASPIMTRLYSVEEIGIYTILMTAITMFGGVLAGRYEMSIIFEDIKKNVYSLIKLSMYFVFCSSILVSIFYSLYYYYSNNGQISYIFLFFTLFFLLLFTGVNNVITSLLNRKKAYKLMSKARVSLSTGKEFSMIGMGLLNFGVSGLILSQIIGRIISIIIELIPVKDELSRAKTSKNTDVVRIADKHKRQPVYSVPALFANSFSYSSINIFVEILFGATTLGFYSMSYRMLGVPLTLISNSVSKVYFEEASRESKNSYNYKKTFLKTSLLLLCFSIPFTIIIIFISPWLFSFIFGSEWRIAGRYVQILAPMFGIRLVVSPLTSGVLISNKQTYELMIQSFLILSSILIFIIANIYNVNIEFYLMLISIFFFIFYMIYYIVLYKLAIKTNKYLISSRKQQK